MTLNPMPCRLAELQPHAEAAAKIDSLPVQNPHAAGIDVGDRTHWVCVEQTPDGSPTTREFPVLALLAQLAIGLGVLPMLIFLWVDPSVQGWIDVLVRLK